MINPNDKAYQLEEDLDEIDSIDTLPEEILDEFIDNTQNFFDSYVTSRIELKTLADIQEAENAAEAKPEQKRTRRRYLGEDLPEEIKNLMQNANEQYMKGDFNRAIQFSREAMEKCPRAPEPYNMLSLISEETGNKDVALQFLAKAAENTRDPSGLWVECARLAKEQNQIHACIGYFKNAIRSSPDNETALDNLQQLLNLLNENDIDDNKARSFVYKELHRRNPLEPQYTIQLIRHQQSMGQNLKALETLSSFIDGQIAASVIPDLACANILATGLLSEGQNDAVLALDEKITAIVPDAQADFRVNAGIAYIRQHKIERAMPILELLIENECDPTVFDSSYWTAADELIRYEYHTQAINWLMYMQEHGIECRSELASEQSLAGHLDDAAKTLESLIIDQNTNL